MKRLLTVLSLSLALAACGGQPRGPSGPPLRPVANPGAVIAAEIGFSKLAQEKGQWTAFRAAALPDAVMFVPQMVLAQQHLKDKADPAKAVTWQPHQVWSSCDGSLAVTRGAWQNGAASGYFTTVWARQRDGKYKWAVDMGEALPMPLDAPDMIVAKVGDCAPGFKGWRAPPKPKGKQPAPVFDPAQRSGKSDDGTLTWNVAVEPSGARRFAVELMQDGKLTPVQVLDVPAPEAK